jgi:hypothetical protein
MTVSKKEKKNKGKGEMWRWQCKLVLGGVELN